MRLSTLILPIHRWNEGRKVWRRAEELGFHAAYTFDHLSWRGPFRNGTWFGAVPTLTAAATATERMRLGTMVTSPNFRHPVTLAKELMTLDDVSGGRMTLGVGAGGAGYDASALLGGGQEWGVRERTERFEEFVPLLDELLTNEVVTRDGKYYRAHEVRNIPGCVQRPRVPFAVAATGPRGMRLAARYGQAWITEDRQRWAGGEPEESLRTLREQTGRLEQACAEAGRAVGELDKIMLTSFTADRSTQSFEAFVDFAGRHAEAGVDELVLHWPVPDTPFAGDLDLFERVATEAPSQLG